MKLINHLKLTSMLLAAGIGGGLVTDALMPARIVTIPQVAFHPQSFAERMLMGGAQESSATALGVNVIVTEVSINPTANNYTESVSLAPGDTSGLSSFSESWQGPGTTPRYAIGGTATISLP
jgi:hypothetical protein